MKRITITFFLLFLIGFGSINTIKAQEIVSRNWHYLGEVYLMFPNMSGETGVGNLPQVSVDANVSDIFGNLEMGAMFYLEATNDDWAISSDIRFDSASAATTATRFCLSSSSFSPVIRNLYRKYR